MNSIDSRLARMAMANGKISPGVGYMVITGIIPFAQAASHERNIEKNVLSIELSGFIECLVGKKTLTAEEEQTRVDREVFGLWK